VTSQLSYTTTVTLGKALPFFSFLPPDFSPQAFPPFLSRHDFLQFFSRQVCPPFQPLASLHMAMSWAILLQHNTTSSTSPPTPPPNPRISAAVKMTPCRRSNTGFIGVLLRLGGHFTAKITAGGCVCVARHLLQEGGYCQAAQQNELSGG
jgi:hypothetical protein